MKTKLSLSIQEDKLKSYIIYIDVKIDETYQQFIELVQPAKELPLRDFFNTTFYKSRMMLTQRRRFDDSNEKTRLIEAIIIREVEKQTHTGTIETVIEAVNRYKENNWFTI